MIHRRQFILSASATVFLASCNRKHPSSAVTIGGVLPLTGDAAPFGINASKGASLAINEYNKSSAETKFVWKIEDSAGTPLQGVSAARKLIDIDKARGIVGGVTSSVTHALIPIITEAQIPLISPSASDPALSGASKYFARVWPSDLFEVEELSAFAVSSNFDKIAAVYINDDYGNGMVSAFEKSGSTEKLIKIPYEETTSDFRATISRISDEGFSAILLVAFPDKAQIFLNQMMEGKLDIPILATATIEDPSVLKSKVPSSSLVFSSPRAAESSETREVFTQLYIESYGEEPGVLADTGYDCAKLLLDNYKEDDGLGSIKAIKSLERYPGASGRMTFKEDGDVIKEYGLRTIADGKFVWVN